MHRNLLVTLVALALAGLVTLGAMRQTDASLEVSAFTVEHSVVVAATPEQAWDAFTGDVTEWWDHSFSQQPAEMAIEPWPGGRFIEKFGTGDDGALHARVTYAERPKTLRFTGPLGFASVDMHFDMAHTFRFEEVEGGTRVSVRVVGLGTVQTGWEQAVQGVWQHFLNERFKPYVEGEL
jgi:uncharacterized protein YndB with AHSA1/START domain